MAAPIPKPRASRPSQELVGPDLPPPPSFPPPNRPHVPPNEFEQADDYVNSDSLGEVLQRTESSKPSAPDPSSAPDPPDDSPRTGLKPKNKAPPPPPGARGNRSTNSPVLATKSHAPHQLSDPAPPRVTSPAPAKPLTSVIPSTTQSASALPTRPPPPSVIRPQSMYKVPVSPAPMPQVPSPSSGASSDDSPNTGGGGGKGSEDGWRSPEDSIGKDVGLKPKRQAPPRPPIKGGSGTGDQTDSADSSDSSQYKEGVVSGGVAKENGEEPKLKQGIGETREDVVKATPPGPKVKPFSKVGRVALPGMIVSAEKKLVSEKQTTSTDMGRTPDASRQPADMGRTPDASRQPADMGRTRDASRQPADMGRTPDASRQQTDMGRTPDASRQQTDMGRTPDASRQPADMGRTRDASRQPADMGRTPDASRQPADMGRTPDASRQPADMSKLADTSVMLWDMANMGIFSIELHKGHHSIGLIIVTGKLKCTSGGVIDGIFIQRVIPNTPASKDGRVQRGDMLLEVANRSTVGVSIEEATRMLKVTSEDVKLKIGRPPDGAVIMSAEDHHDNTLSPEVLSNEDVEQLKMKLKAELQAQATQFFIERKAVENELEKLKKEHEASKNEHEASKNEHTQFARMEQQKMSELAQALATITMEKLKCDRELETARSTLAQNPPAELSALRGEVTTLQSQLSSLRSELLAVKEEKINITQQLQDSQLQLQESRLQCDRELETARSTLAQNPPAELSALRGEVTTLQSQLSSLRSELSDAHDAKKSIEEQWNMTQKQLVFCQKECDIIKNAMLLERERALGLQQALQADQKKCTCERDALAARVQLLSEALEVEKKKCSALEILLAQSSQSNALGDIPVHMTHELANPVQGASGNNVTHVTGEHSDVIGEKGGAVLSDRTAVPVEDRSDLAVLNEHTTNEASYATDTLFITEGQLLIKSQDDPPSHDEQPSSVTPSHDEQPSSVTSSHDEQPSSVTSSHDEPSSVTPSHEQPSSVTPSHDEQPSSGILSHEQPSSVTSSHDGSSVPSAQSVSKSQNVVPNDVTGSLVSDEGRNHDIATATSESVVLDHTHSNDTIDFSGIPSISRLDSSQSLHKKELGTKLRRKRPSRSHLQRMGQESGMTVSTGDLTAERAESPEAPVPSEKPHKAAVPLPKKANSIDVSELVNTDIPEPSCKPSTEAHKAPVPVPRPKPTPRGKDKGSKPSEEQDVTGGVASSDGTSGNRPISGSPRPSPMSSPKPSPKHVVGKSSDGVKVKVKDMKVKVEDMKDDGVKVKVKDMKVKVEDMKDDGVKVEDMKDDEMKGVPKPLPKPRSTAKLAGEVDHTTPMDSKTDIEIAAKDPSELTIKERALLAQRTLAPKDKLPKGLPPVAKKPEPHPATSLEDSPQLDTVVSSEPLAKPKKLPPGAFSMMMPGVRKPHSDQQESTHTSLQMPGNTSLQMPESSTPMDNEQSTSADAEVAEHKVPKKLPAGAFSMVPPGSSPGNVPLPQKPSMETNEITQRTESSEAFPQRSWSSGAKKLPLGAFNMAAGGISRSGEGINRGLSGQSPQLSRDSSMTASSELPSNMGTPPSVKRPLENAMMTPSPVTQPHDESAVLTPSTAVDSRPPVDTSLPPPPSQPLPLSSSQPLPPPPSQPLPATSAQSPSVPTKDDVEEDSMSLNEENVNTSRPEDSMADNASTDGLDLPSGDDLDYDQVLTWTVTQVVKWLSDAGLGQYAQGFTDKNILGSALLELDGAKLKSAVSDAEDRNIFKKKVKALKAHVEKRKKAVEKEKKKMQEAEKKLQKKKGK